MKKFLLVANIVLLVAVAVLFFLFFEYKNADQHKIAQTNAAVSNNFKIAYFDLDSLEIHYEYAKEVRDYLRGKEDQMTRQLNQLRNNYMNKLKEYNQKGPTMTQTEQSDYQQQLMKMQNDYQQKGDELAQDMQMESARKLQEVKGKIQDFLKGFCKEKGYSYVFASNENDYLYYKDTLRNITPEIVRLLNDQHKLPAKK